MLAMIAESNIFGYYNRPKLYTGSVNVHKVTKDHSKSQEEHKYHYPRFATNK